MYNSKKNNVLVIAAHPDDEILGCGGTMALHSKNGDKVNVLLMSKGIKSRDKTKNIEKKISSLSSAAMKANKSLGAKKITLLDYPDNSFDTVKLLTIVKSIENMINLLKPNIIYTHHHGDLNIDHEIINRAVLTACRPVPKSSLNKIFTFEVNSSTEWSINKEKNLFIPNWYVDISKTIKLKKKALSFYNSEMKKWPHARSIKSVEILARRRGSIVGLNFAESFHLVRSINI